MKYKIKKANTLALSLKYASNVKKLGVEKSVKSKKKNLFAYNVGIILCIAVFLGTVAYFIAVSHGYSHAEDVYNDIQNSVLLIERLPYMDLPGSDQYLTDYDTLLSGGAALSGGSTSESIEFIKFKTQLKSLQRINDDIIGWITVLDTGIDYPLLRGDDNAFYLDHAYDGAYLNAGSIFIDYRCKDPLDDTLNGVIYGHNMFSGLMFHDVIKYNDEDFFLTHDITISTADGIYTYRPFAIYKTVATERYFDVSFASDEAYVRFLETAKSKSLFDTDYSPSANDRIITFSTCTNESTDGRLVLHAVLIEKRT